MHAIMLALSLALPAGMPADGSYTYVTLVGGQQAGKTTITVAREPDGVRVVENGSAAAAGTSASGNATLTLDARLVPTGYTASYVRNGRPYAASLRFKGAWATQSGTIAATSFALGPDERHFVVLDGTLFAGFFMLPSQMLLWKDAPALAVAPMLAADFPVAPDATMKPERPSGVPAGDTEISFTSPIEITLWYDPLTLVVDEMDVPSQAAAIIRQKS